MGDMNSFGEQRYSHILRNLSFKQIKADRSNRLEHLKLLVEKRLLDREAGHLVYTMSREKRDILQNLDKTNKTTGYSSESQRPSGTRDSAIQSSPYFSSGRKLSEKHFLRWRMVEARLERELHLSDLERLHKQQEQICLLNLLRDIGVIPADAEIRLPNQIETKQKSEKRRNGRISTHLIDNRKLINSSDQMTHSLLLNKNSNCNSTNNMQSSDNKINSQASIPDSKMSTEVIDKVKLLRQRPQTVGTHKFVTKRLPDRSRLQSANQIESQKTEDDVQIKVESEGCGKNEAFNKSQWYRDLLIEAPPTVNTISEPVKIKLAVSRSALKQQLKEMQNSYEFDINRITRDEIERKKANKKHVMALTNAMRQMNALQVN